MTLLDVVCLGVGCVCVAHVIIWLKGRLRRVLAGMPGGLGCYESSAQTKKPRCTVVTVNDRGVADT